MASCGDANATSQGSGRGGDESAARSGGRPTVPRDGRGMHIHVKTLTAWSTANQGQDFGRTFLIEVDMPRSTSENVDSSTLLATAEASRLRQVTRCGPSCMGPSHSAPSAGSTSCLTTTRFPWAAAPISGAAAAESPWAELSGRQRGPARSSARSIEAHSCAYPRVRRRRVRGRAQPEVTGRS